MKPWFVRPSLRDSRPRWRRLRPILSIALVGTVLFLSAAPSQAAPPSSSGLGQVVRLPFRWYEKGQRQFDKGVARLAQIEFVQMLAAIHAGSSMGPGDGWFHPGQSRYSWQWLAQHFDRNKDGKISRQEFPGSAKLFARLDRDGDGYLTADDLDWSNQSLFLQHQARANMLFQLMNTKRNGRITAEDWQALFQKLAKGKDYLTVEDLRAIVPAPTPPQPTRPMPPQMRKMMVATLTNGLIAGELGSILEGPRIGDQAPDFTLKTQDGQQTITLSQFRGQKPVVLVFGSFT
jgi:Ca2+-binding EF-hand superfamily protein